MLRRAICEPVRAHMSSRVSLDASSQLRRLALPKDVSVSMLPAAQATMPVLAAADVAGGVGMEPRSVLLGIDIGTTSAVPSGTHCSLCFWSAVAMRLLVSLLHRLNARLGMNNRGDCIDL